MKSVLVSIKTVISASWRIDPKSCRTVACESLGNLAEISLPISLAMGLSGVLQRNALLAVIGLSMFGLAIGMNMLLMITGIQARIKLIEQVGHWFDNEVISAVAGAPNLALLEAGETRADIQILRDSNRNLGRAFGALVISFNKIFIPTGAIVVASLIDVRLLLLLPFAMPILYLNAMSAKADAAVETNAAGYGTVSYKMATLVLNPSTLIETKAHREESSLHKLFLESIYRWRSPSRDFGVKYAIFSTAANLFYYVGASVLVVWIFSDVQTGRASVAVLAASILIVNGLQDSADALRSGLRSLFAAARNTSKALAISNINAQAPVEFNSGIPAQHPASPSAFGVSLENVTFAYSDSSRAVIGPVNLQLSRGEIIAIVGKNGSGKSSLVKVLSGVYAPTTGMRNYTGPLSGAPPRSPAREPIVVNASFQDGLDLEATFAEIIGLGDPPNMGDINRTALAADIAGCRRMIEDSALGWETAVGSTWCEGRVLSAGQLQKLRVAQSLMRQKPHIVILDEPTSALDPKAEYDFLRKYATFLKDSYSDSISLIVTHRFSTVRFADRILVMDNGLVSEQGSHEELMRNGKLYCSMYSEQAASYK